MKIVYCGKVTISALWDWLEMPAPIPSMRWEHFAGTEIVKGLIENGHTVDIVLTDPYVHEAAVYKSHGLTLHLFPERRWRNLLLSLFFQEVQCVRECIISIKPDVVLANWTYQYARAGVTSGVPCLVVARDSPWRCLWRIHSFAFLVKTLYSQFFVFPKIRHLSTISPHMVEDLRKFNRYKGDIKVIPNGIKVDWDFKKHIRRDAKTILCVSEWNPLKNIKTLFRAFANLRMRHPDWRLLAVGNCIDDAVAGVWMRKNSVLADGVELLGRKTQAEIKSLLRNEVDIFCSPTLEESFGQVFLEAMAQGVPCIGGEKSGAVPWVIGEGGVVCDVTKPEKLAECIERVMENWELRKKLSDGGLRRVREMFDIEKSVKSYENALVEIANK